MTPEEHARMNQLCARIAEEKDPATFDRLVRELNDLFEGRYERLNPQAPN